MRTEPVTGITVTETLTRTINLLMYVHCRTHFATGREWLRLLRDVTACIFIYLFIYLRLLMSPALYALRDERLCTQPFLENKKLSLAYQRLLKFRGRIFCSFWDTWRRTDNPDWNDLKMYSKVLAIWALKGTKRKLVYDFLLVLCSNFCRITHRLREIWCETLQWPRNIAKVIGSVRIIWKLSCDFLYIGSLTEDVSCVVSEILEVKWLPRLKWPSNVLQSHQK